MRQLPVLIWYDLVQLLEALECDLVSFSEALKFVTKDLGAHFDLTTIRASRQYISCSGCSADAVFLQSV